MINPNKIFQNQHCINLETFRKNGVGVKTPVWFAQDEEEFRVWTLMNSGKVKRIRLNSQVRIAPSKADGTPLGDWLPAKATADASDKAMVKTKTMFAKKYGLSFRLSALLGKIKREKYTSIRIVIFSLIQE